MPTYDDDVDMKFGDIIGVDAHKVGTCQNCYTAPGRDGVICPYAEDIHGERRECNCCAECYRSCIYDI